jgi:Uma2 family endonuclease
MTTTLDQQITLAEFLKLPETKPASEFINGRIYHKPMPQGKHSRLQLKLCNAVNQVAEEQQIALAFPELRCTFGGRSIVPDVTVFSWDGFRLTLKAKLRMCSLFIQIGRLKFSPPIRMQLK